MWTRFYGKQSFQLPNSQQFSCGGFFLFLILSFLCLKPLVSHQSGPDLPVATIQLVQSNSHALLIALASVWPVTPTAAATWKAHLLATILCCCHPPFKSEGKEGWWKGEEGKREAHPERMLDKDGSRDILSTFISSGGGELCWILARYEQSHILCSTDGE